MATFNVLCDDFQTFEAYLKNELSTIPVSPTKTRFALTLGEITKNVWQSWQDSYYCSGFMHKRFLPLVLHLIKKHYIQYEEVFYLRDKWGTRKRLERFLKKHYRENEYLELGNFQYGFDVVRDHLEHLFDERDLASWTIEDCKKHWAKYP